MGWMIAEVMAQQHPQLVRKRRSSPGLPLCAGEGIDKVTRITYLDTAR